jgi:23S rRNA (adenine2030-N6)-methyltransferase
MNYRHSFHAGNFADLVKHAGLLSLLRTLAPRGPLTVVDTHAGAGLYDLDGDAARSKEAEAGVLRLMAADELPEPLARLREAVRALNPDGRARWYPGSPRLAAAAPGVARYVGFELNPPVAGALTEALEGIPHAVAESGDGYEAAPVACRAPGLLLIDPPFERPDDYLRAAGCAAEARRLRPGVVVAIWTPLKDLETFDGFLRALAAAGQTDVLVVEARLRPLVNPMKMNGCTLTLIGAPPAAEPELQAVADWVVGTLGEAGGRARLWRP